MAIKDINQDGYMYLFQSAMTAKLQKAQIFYTVAIQLPKIIPIATVENYYYRTIYSLNLTS